MEFSATPIVLLTRTHIYGNMASMKTTLEVPDELFRQAKATAALKGKTLKAFVTEALLDKLGKTASAQRRAVGWRAAFGRVPSKYTRRIDAILREEFSKIDPEDWK